MWILLLVILTPPPVHIEHSTVLQIHYSEQTCIKELNRAMSLDPPPNTNLGCVKIEGVSRANGEKLQE